MATAKAVAAAVGLPADEAVILQNSNRVTMRLLPGDVLARVAPAAHQAAQFEIDLTQRLVAAGSPVATLDPRVTPRIHERDGLVVTLWTYYSPLPLEAAAYADALTRLHTGMRSLEVPVPHFTHRVRQAQQIVDDPGRSPALTGPDRELLSTTLRDLGRSVAERAGTEQLLHGEPHPGNVLGTKDGVLFIDLETCCHGPVEYDLAHAPEEVGRHYPGIDQDLLRDCRTLVLAVITAWRWDQADQLPDGLRLGQEWLSQLRTTTGRPDPEVR